MILKAVQIIDLNKQIREIEVHKKLNYKYVIKLIDYEVTENNIVMLIEYAKYGDLFSILGKLSEFPERRVHKFYY